MRVDSAKCSPLDNCQWVVTYIIREIDPQLSSTGRSS
jgi:hypothetical protein